jgi:hypothetical protein
MLDTIVVSVIALLAGGYLFWRFRAAANGKNPPCGCGTCGGTCGLDKGDCRGCRALMIAGGERISDKS